MQTNTVLMVRHAAFMSNQETQASNAFQKRLTGIRDVQIQAQIAFDSYVRALRSVDIDVHIVDDVAEHGTPDSLFPNNWIRWKMERFIPFQWRLPIAAVSVDRRLSTG